MTHATIAAQVSALAASQVAQPANDPMSAFAIELAQLAAAATPQMMTAPGSILPDAPLLDLHGAATTLYDAPPGDHSAVLVFYRGAWCPFCNIALRTYQLALLPELDRRRVALVAISPQAPDGSLTMQEKNDLTFTVLSDPGLHLARSVGIETAPSGGGPRSPAAARSGPHGRQRRRHHRRPDADHVDPRCGPRGALGRRPP